MKFTNFAYTGSLLIVGLGLVVVVGGCGQNSKPDNVSDSGKSPSETQQPKTMRTATAVAEIGGNGYWSGVTNLVITDPGEGYPDFEFGKALPLTEGVTVPTITFTGGGGKRAEAVVEAVANGKVKSVRLASGGDGYTNAPKVEFQSPQDLRLGAKAKRDKEAEERRNREIADSEHKKGTERSKCADNMNHICLTAHTISALQGAVTVEALGEGIGLKGLKAQCPSGAAYIVCDLKNYNTESGDKVLIYCRKHLLVEGKDVFGPTYCDAAEFKSQIEMNLLNSNNVAEQINKIAATATPESTEPTDPNPTGTWTAGNKNSVYSRLVVRSSGAFSFETVDFTGDVKGGYSGSWEMNGNSIRFKWDGGSCSGRRTGRSRLVFGSTTFSK